MATDGLRLLRRDDDSWDRFQPEHRQDLQKSGLTLETVLEAGIYTARPGDIAKLLGWDAPGVISALVFPYPETDGFIRIKAFPPYIGKNGKEAKYLQKPKTGVQVYLPPGINGALTDSTVEIAWTEGEKKALKASQEGIPCIGLGGLWNWIEDNQAIDGLNLVTHNGRTEIFYPDSDAWGREDLLRAVYAFGREVQARGGIPYVRQLPTGPDGQKVGLDDFLCTQSVEALQALPLIPLDAQVFKGYAKWWRGWRDKKLQQRKASLRQGSPYRVFKGRMVYLSQPSTGFGPMEVTPIADFAAQITDEQTNEDGSKIFRIEGMTIRGVAFALEVDAKTFSDERELKALLTEAAGADAPIYSGMHRHLPAAIQLLSTPARITHTKRYGRTGWAGEAFLEAVRKPMSDKSTL